jgi:hypothetical protein
VAEVVPSYGFKGPFTQSGRWGVVALHDTQKIGWILLFCVVPYHITCRTYGINSLHNCWTVYIELKSLSRGHCDSVPAVFETDRIQDIAIIIYPPYQWDTLTV